MAQGRSRLVKRTWLRLSNSQNPRSRRLRHRVIPLRNGTRQESVGTPPHEPWEHPTSNIQPRTPNACHSRNQCMLGVGCSPPSAQGFKARTPAFEEFSLCPAHCLERVVAGRGRRTYRLFQYDWVLARAVGFHPHCPIMRQWGFCAYLHAKVGSASVWGRGEDGVWTVCGGHRQWGQPCLLSRNRTL